MNLSTLNIAGSLFSPEILEALGSQDMPGQKPSDFGLDKQVWLRTEIEEAWGHAKSAWQMFSRSRARLSKNRMGTQETQQWVNNFLGYVLGYELVNATPQTIRQREYAISHCEPHHEAFPVHMLSFKHSLDQKPPKKSPKRKTGISLSPHALVQEYLNLSGHLYALLTNGLQLRVLRDSTRLIRLTFLEFDLEQMMEQDHYSDFAILYRLLHVSRLPKSQAQASQSWLEQYHQQSLQAGARIRHGLSNAVRHSIEHLANGVLNYPPNQAILDEVMPQGKRSADELYQNLLDFVYRLLFLMVIEERQLVYPKVSSESAPGQAQLKQIYEDYYSVTRLRWLSEKRQVRSNKHHDLWQGLLQTFGLYESETEGQALGIKPLSGKLFSPQAMPWLKQLHLDNQTLQECIAHLSLFYNTRAHQRLRVNYGALNVEEFGSIYENLLDYTPYLYQGTHSVFTLRKGEKRMASGAHYTPEGLVSPLIKNSLEHVIQRAQQRGNPEKALLEIRVCDIACGSGHLLLAAARRLGLAIARVRAGEDQPNPIVLRSAIRDAIRHCIYGVDKNPMAVELCKVALWLEAHSPGEPMFFLDHKIKCGDSVVGLLLAHELRRGISNEAFLTQKEGDDGKITSQLQKNNKAAHRKLASKNQVSQVEQKDRQAALQEMQQAFAQLEQLPETSADDIQRKQQQYKALQQQPIYQKCKQLADIQVAQFLQPKTNLSDFITHQEYIDYLHQDVPLKEHPRNKANEAAANHRFFHWFLEFPAIFQEDRPGFDCILGNPPFLGGLRIKTFFGDHYAHWLGKHFEVAGRGTCDLVAYFFRRAFDLLKPDGIQGLVSTNSISAGDTKKGGLDVIVAKGGVITFVIRSLKWEGEANATVSLSAISKTPLDITPLLDGKEATIISTDFNDVDVDMQPFALAQNKGQMFNGTYVLGDDFLLTPEQGKDLLAQEDAYKKVIFPLMDGEDVTTHYLQVPSRYIINFHDWSLNRAKKYQAPFSIVEELVKPYRLGHDKKQFREKWWLFAGAKISYYKRLKKMKTCFVIPETVKHHVVSAQPTHIIFNKSLYVYIENNFAKFAILQSNMHEAWVNKHAPKRGGNPRYALRKCFENFPFPQALASATEKKLRQVGEAYHEFRTQLLLDTKLGLTEIYNQFHNAQLQKVEEVLPQVAFEQKYGDKSWNLWRHLQDTDKAIEFDEAVDRVMQLRVLHTQMDVAVLEAYDWQDIDLNPGFYELTFLAANDRQRFTIAPEARRELLKRLVLLNHEVYEGEQDLQ